MLLGGVEKVLENGSRIRGDINVLLIGICLLRFAQIMSEIYGKMNGSYLQITLCAGHEIENSTITFCNSMNRK